MSKIAERICAAYACCVVIHSSLLMDVLECVYKQIRSFFFSFWLLYCAGDDCTAVGRFRDYRSTTSLWFCSLHPLFCLCRVVCVRWWIRVTCASHRLGDGLFFISFFLFVWLPLSIPCDNPRTTWRLDTRNQRRCSREKQRQRKEDGIRESWEESHMAWSKWHDLFRPSKFQLPSLGSLCCVLLNTQTDTLWPCVSDCVIVSELFWSGFLFLCFAFLIKYASLTSCGVARTAKCAWLHLLEIFRFEIDILEPVELWD